MKIIFLGPPGVGKGTIAKRILNKLDAIQISTGDLLRDAIKNQTHLGVEAKGYMDAGDLVPDELVINLIKEKVKKQDNFILDGVPRTIPQAEALDKVVKIDRVVSFEAPKEVIIQRLSGRRTCPKCGFIYHIKNIPPQVEGICDKCKVKLIQRDDDKPEAIKNRLKVYEEKTAPLIDYYEKKGKLVTVDAGERDIDFIVSDTLNALNRDSIEEE